MFVQRLIMLFPLFALLAWAALIDLRSRKIPNWLTLAIAVTGFAHSFLTIAGVGVGPGSVAVSPLFSFLGLLTGLVLNVPLFAAHIRGGGDVKLFAALGAWVGPLMTFEIFVVSTLVAAIAALVQAIMSGKLSPLLRNTGMLAVSLAHPKELGVAHVTREDGSFRSVGRPVPYAVPVIIATILVMAFVR